MEFTGKVCKKIAEQQGWPNVTKKSLFSGTVFTGRVGGLHPVSAKTFYFLLFREFQIVAYNYIILKTGSDEIVH